MLPELKIYITPELPPQDDGRGGIMRIIEALHKYLPQFNITPVSTAEEADIINCHVGGYVDDPTKPIVSSNHGLYWTDVQWTPQHYQINQNIIDILKRVDAITAPSNWVTQAINRGLSKPITVINHGIDPTEWDPNVPHEGYVLYNKNRVDAVCDPKDLVTLAQMMGNVHFKATTLNPEHQRSDNLEEIGIETLDKHRQTIAKAGVYLSVTRETLGNSILEAMACGVPVAGWDFGGASEIIRNGHNGYLAPYGDFNGLANCIINCMQERETLGANARQDILDNWTWTKQISKYADVFRKTHTEFHGYETKVSVIVPCWNDGKHLGEALTSVLNQTETDWECIIVNDASTDNTEQIAQEFVAKDSRFKYIKNPSNLDVSSSRNIGVRSSKGRYLAFLDADDQMQPKTLALLSHPLDVDRGLHLAYGHVDTTNDDSSKVWRNEKWPFDWYSWHQQLAHMNQIPILNLMRASTFKNCGGFRNRYSRGEDAHLWAFMTSMGYIAKKVTSESTLIYRLHDNQKTRKMIAETGEQDSHWTAWLPWKLADTMEQGRNIDDIYEREFDVHFQPNLVPFGAQGNPPTGAISWDIRHYNDPEISIIIPVCEQHLGWIIDAIDSVLAQDFQNWELIIVNDSGLPIKNLPGAYYAKIITPPDQSKSYGPAVCRNVGAYHAKGEALLFLDADDFLVPGRTLTEMWSAFVKKDKQQIIYGDYFEDNGDQLSHITLPEPYCGDNIEKTSLKLPTRPVTCLLPRFAHYQVGGFDETFEVWEDWAWEIALDLEFCATKIEIPTFIYRRYSSVMRIKADPAMNPNQSQAIQNRDIYKQRLYEKYIDYYQGTKKMGTKKCCGGLTVIEPDYAPQTLNKQTKQATVPLGQKRVRARQLAIQSRSRTVLPNQPSKGNLVRIRYVGKQAETRIYKGQVTNKRYRFGNNSGHREKMVDSRDAVFLLTFTQAGLGVFVRPKPITQAPVKKPEIMTQIPDEGVRTIVPETQMPKYAKDIIRAVTNMDDQQMLAEWLNNEKKRGTNTRKTVTQAIEQALQMVQETHGG